MESLKVQDLMTSNVVSVRANEDLSVLHDMMFENHFRHLPVVDEEENVIGLVSHRDLVGTALYAGDTLPVTEVQQLLRNTQVREIMITGVETVDPETSLEEAGRILLENKFGCLPVTEGTKLVGILTESDFIRYFVEEQEAARTGKQKLAGSVGTR